MQRLWEQANLAALFCLFIYSAHKAKDKNGETIKSILSKTQSDPCLHKAIEGNNAFADAKIQNLTLSENGMTACAFELPNKEIYVVYKGTGSGEWIDNGEGLSGIPEENTYFTYNNGKILKRTIVSRDFASDQQAEALNWFNRIADLNKWDKSTKIHFCGHSKGGNKAQFVFLKCGLGENCFSFCGQGFSPEAINAFKSSLGEDFEARRKNIFSISPENDYVNVLGKRLMPKSNIIYIKSQSGLHQMKCLLDTNGSLHPKAIQGRISLYAQGISEELTDMPPFIRKYATLGIMNIFQKYLGRGEPVNGDSVSIEKTIAGIALSVPPFLKFWR